MKEFIAVFIGCFILGYIGIAIFVTVGSFWAVFIAVTFLVAVFITIIMKMAIKMEEIEKKLDGLLDHNYDSSE